jgi:hypothetical protein
MGLQISCPCGIMTKICKTDLHLNAVWNSRPKKLVTVPKVEVKGLATDQAVEKVIKEREIDVF